MKTTGYMMECVVCHKREFFDDSEDYLDGDWYNGIPGSEHGGEHLCTDCWNEQEDTRDEQAKLALAEDEISWGDRAAIEEAIHRQ